VVGIVTLTTVGYGDIVPKTPTGRWAGVTIMLTGIAVLGVLAGSLASFFRIDRDVDKDNSTEERQPSTSGDSTTNNEFHQIMQEITALRAQVELLTPQSSERRDEE
jgi:voltage-gated potassium channel